MCNLLLNVCILLCNCQARVVISGSHQASNHTSVLSTNPSTPRKVHLITDLDHGREVISLRTGDKIYGGHGRMWIDGTEHEGPLLIELGVSPIAGRPGTLSSYAVRVSDLGVANTGQPRRGQPKPGYVRYDIEVGETSLRNPEMFDHEAGTGLIADAWLEDPIYRMGTGSEPNTCYDLLERTLGRMHIALDPVTKKLNDQSREYYTLYSSRMIERVGDVASMRYKPTDQFEMPTVEVETKVFNVDSEYNPDAPEVVYRRKDYLPARHAMLTAAAPSRFLPNSTIEDATLNLLSLE